VAIFAGATPLVGFQLGLAMTALQLGIGAINDVVDAARDAGHKPGKPIPAGLVSRPVGGLIGLAAFGLGLLLAALVALLSFGLALVVVAIGLTYDLRLKGTAWSWLPFAVGIPMLPVFGWAGATGGLTAMFAVLVPAAVAAGGALAIANSLVDVDRDRAAGIESVAIALGERRAQGVAIVLLVAIALAAAASTYVFGGGSTATLIVGLLGCVPPVAAGLARHRDPKGREVAWTAQAIGLGALAVVWVWAIPR
jgi:4-hydroxybenzoate polyprenyltransferase